MPSDRRCRCEALFHRGEKYWNKLPEMVKNSVSACMKNTDTDHLDTAMMPSREAVIDLIGCIRDILFPGYFGSRQISAQELPFYISDRMSYLFQNLSDQISRSLMHECRRFKKKCSNCREKGYSETVSFISKLPDLKDVLTTDVQAAYDGDPAAGSLDEIIFCYPGFSAITVYRIAHELYLQNIPLLPRIMTEYAHTITGIDIHPGASAGRNFFIDHGTGVVIGETTVIGEKVRIYQGVTLGALSIPVDENGNVYRGTKRHPTIEDEVIIYANATILGGDTVIGKGSVIGGNVWVTQSIPPDTKVLLKSPELVFRKTKKES